MPTYEYRCPDGHTFDVFQKMSDEPGATCPECGKDADRQISAGAGFLFKGEGFYITDYRSDEYRRKASTEKGGGTSSDAGSGGKAAGDASSGSDSGSDSGGKSDSAPASGSGGSPGSSSAPGGATSGGSTGRDG